MNTRFSAFLNVAALAVTLSLTGCLEKSGESQFAGELPPPSGSTNQTPTINGNPSSGVKVGEAYSFTPSASDPDGDELTFRISNMPIWASFDTGTGALSGTPTLANVGSFSNIQITVSDGEDSASLSAFSVDVTQVAMGSANLSWTAPTENEDGTPLVGLAGYKIYYGRSSGSYSNEIRIDNPSVTTYLVDNLSQDTYYFAATAFNSAGVESRFSSEAIKVVN